MVTHSLQIDKHGICEPEGGGGGGRVLPYIGYTGMGRWKGYGFQTIYSGIGSSNHRKIGLVLGPV